jgi:hypothetical protein
LRVPCGGAGLFDDRADSVLCPRHRGVSGFLYDSLELVSVSLR